MARDFRSQKQYCKRTRLRNTADWYRSTNYNKSNTNATKCYFKKKLNSNSLLQTGKTRVAVTSSDSWSTNERQEVIPGHTNAIAKSNTCNCKIEKKKKIYWYLSTYLILFTGFFCLCMSITLWRGMHDCSLISQQLIKYGTNPEKFLFIFVNLTMAKAGGTSSKEILPSFLQDTQPLLSRRLELQLTPTPS